MKIIAPWRTWEFKSREDEIEYAEKDGYSSERLTEKQTTQKIRTYGT